MKRFLVLFLVVVPLIASAQDAPPNHIIFETNYLKVIPGHFDDFRDAMSSHNQEFHPEGPHQAFVHRVVNGPRTGQLTWIMGPTSFTHLDSRPNDEAHTSDWVNNVMVHTDGEQYNEYWRFRPNLSFKSDSVLYPILRVRIIDVTSDEAYRFVELVKQIQAVLVAKDYPNEWNVYSNRLWHDDGRDWAFVTSFNSWSELDSDVNFADDFREVHGANEWEQFLEEWEEVVDSAFDEYRTFMPALGGVQRGD